VVDEALAQWAEGRVEELAGTLTDRGLTLAVAESLTGGLLTEVLARGPGASEWLRGGVVAYASEVKHDVLGVRPGPVVSEAAALDMARGAARVLGADVGLAVTGVGGPDPQDDQPPGTVWMALHEGGTTQAHLHRFPGSPAEICDATCRTMIEWARSRLLAAPPGGKEATHRAPPRPAR
jgi:nicotinamide-nucleotide amidase